MAKPHFDNLNGKEGGWDSVKFLKLNCNKIDHQRPWRMGNVSFISLKLFVPINTYLHCKYIIYN